MPVTNDMVAMWRRPATVLRRHFATGRREDRALAFLMAGCFLVFVAQLPRLSRTAHETGAEFAQLASYELLGWVMLWPLGFYGLAALGWLVARAAGSRASAYDSRLSLFWAHLSAAPAALLYGLLAGFNGFTTGTHVVGALWIAALFTFWIIGLRVAGKAQHA